ncbi:hypothetical protein HN51_016363 [Arachis hypogaea]
MRRALRDEDGKCWLSLLTPIVVRADETCFMRWWLVGFALIGFRIGFEDAWQRLAASSKQIQAVKATSVKTHRQRNATKEIDDIGGHRRFDDEMATVQYR